MSSGARMAHELRFARLDSGARIAWARSGKVGAPVLVQAAQWMTHVEYDLRSPIWQPWLDRLGQRLELIRYDERGCGLSSEDSTPLGLEASVEELGAVIAARAVPRVALLGHSGGAAAAMAYAARYPERVSHLIVLGGYTHGLMHREPSAEALAYFEATVRLVEAGWGRAHPAVQQFFTTSMVPDASAEEAAALNEQQQRSCKAERAAAVLRARTTLDVRHLAPLVRCPTLVLHADGDLQVPSTLGVEVAAAIPGARLQWLRSRNHIPLASEPCFAAFCDAVCDFVSDAATRPALTPRERDLAELLAQGLDNAQIAARLSVADKTVRNALSTLYGKLGVEGRPQAIVQAQRQGFGRGGG